MSHDEKDFWNFKSKYDIIWHPIMNIKLMFRSFVLWCLIYYKFLNSTFSHRLLKYKWEGIWIFLTQWMISLSAYFDKHPLHQDYGVPLKASIKDYDIPYTMWTPLEALSGWRAARCVWRQRRHTPQVAPRCSLEDTLGGSEQHHTHPQTYGQTDTIMTL